MKIVCQSCSAKYSIADDKVQGKKVFKIKCKKCGEDILVRGAEAGGELADTTGGGHPAQHMSEDEQTRVVQSDGQDRVWHAVVNGDQKGAFSVDELREMLANGTIDQETFVWKDGFDDWKPLQKVTELSSLTSAGAPAMTPAASMGGDALFGGAAASAGGGGGGLFSDAKARSASAASEAKARAGSKAAAGGDLFAVEPQSGGAAKPLFGAAAPEEDEVSTSAASPRGDAKAASMTGQRNENSVLFSLASLQQIAGAAAPGGGSAKVSEPGAATRNADQSGLIDIKSMASTFGPSAENKKKAVDEILTVGGGGALSSPLAAPVLAPMPTAAMAVDADKPTGTNKTVLFSVIAVAVILAGGGIAVAMLMRNNAPPATTAATQPAPAVPAAATQGQAAPTAAGSATAPTVAAGAPAAGAAAAAPAAPAAAGSTGGNTLVAANAESSAPASEGGRREHTGGGGSARSAHEPRPSSNNNASSSPSTSSASAATAAPAPSGGSCAARCRGNIDCLLRCGTEGSSARPTPPPTSTGGGGPVPEAPSRADVLSAMNSVRGTVASCGAGQTGTANVAITFANSGRVTTANVAPPFAGTPAGSCIARAVRAAHLPAFSRPTFQINFPFPVH